MLTAPIARGDDPLGGKPAAALSKTLPAKDAKGILGSEQTGTFKFIETRPRDVLLTLDNTALELPKRSLRVRVTMVGGIPWLLPVYVVREVRLPDPTAANPVVKIVVSDALYDDDLDQAIEGAMDIKYTNGGWNKAVPTDNRVVVTLRLKDGDNYYPLGTVKCVREVGQRHLTSGKGERVLAFPLDPFAAAHLATADRANLGLTFDETYLGQFTDPDLIANMSVTNTAATNFKNKLRKDKSGREASLLVAIGGGVGNQLSIRQEFSRQVTVGVWSRTKSVNQTLIDNLIAKLFDGIKEGDSLGGKANDAVVTFLASNGVQVTASYGTFTGMKDQWKKEERSLMEKDQARAWEERKKRAGEAGGWGVSVKFDSEDDHKGSTADRFKEEFQSMSEVMKAIEGKLPIAVLEADQVQKLVSRASSKTEVEIGSFSEGMKLVRHQQSLSETFEVTAKSPAKTDAERYEEVAAKLTNEIADAKKELAELTTARDTIAAENKPHEERLLGLERLLTEAKTAAATAQQALDKANAAFAGEIDKIGPLANRSPEVRAQFERKLGIPELKVALAEKQGVPGKWESESTLHEKNLRPMRARLAKAEKSISDSKDRVAQLEAQLGVFKRLIAGAKP